MSSNNLKTHWWKSGGEYKKGLIPWNKGIKRTDIAGDKHPLWKGGISKTKEYHLMKNEEWRKRNPLKSKCRLKARKYRLKNAGPLTRKAVQLIYEDNIKQFGTLTCIYCLKPILFGKDHLEHKQPISKGGTNEYRNLGIACSKCNLKKGSKTELEFKNQRKE